MTTSTIPSPVLTRRDRCDRCRAAAHVRAMLRTGGEPVPREVQISNNLRRHRACRMIQCRTTKPRVDFFRHRAAANHLTTFKHERLQPALREIARGHEAIVTTTHNCDVVSHFQSIHRFHRCPVQSV